MRWRMRSRSWPGMGPPRRLRSWYARCSGRSVENAFSTDRPEHLAYHERNRRGGPMPGQLRLRIRHRMATTPWFDYLIVSPDELHELVVGSGWDVGQLIEGEAGMYAVVLEKSGP